MMGKIPGRREKVLGGGWGDPALTSLKEFVLKSRWTCSVISGIGLQHEKTRFENLYKRAAMIKMPSQSCLPILRLSPGRIAEVSAVPCRLIRWVFLAGALVFLLSGSPACREQRVGDSKSTR